MVRLQLIVISFGGTILLVTTLLVFKRVHLMLSQEPPG